MVNSKIDFDITKNIRIIEMLKSQLLTDIADLYNNLYQTNSEFSERSDILADLILTTYLLSNRLGLSYNSLDLKVINKLKLGVLEENSPLHDDVSELLRYIYRNQND